MQIVFKPISTSFSPNFQRDDVVFATKLLLGLSRPDKVQLEDRFRKGFKEYQDARFVSLFSSGRASLMFALKALGLSPGDEVLIQGFTCVAVVNAVVWAGLVPVFVDADPKTYNMDLSDAQKKISKKTRALILQHTFGYPADIPKFKKLCQQYNLRLIEDCAHALGSTHQNRRLGTFSDVSIFSFGRDKMLSSVFGGAATTNASKIAKRLSQYEESLSAPPTIFVKKQLLYPVLYAISLSLYQVGLGRGLLWLSRKVRALSPAVFRQEKEGIKPPFLQYTLHPSLMAVAYHQFSKIGQFTSHRKAISDIYRESLNLDLPSKPYLRVPFKTRSKKRLLKLAKKQGIHLGNWYRGVVDPPDVVVKEKSAKTCKNASMLARTTINLPTHINTTPKDARAVVRFLNQNKELW